MEDQFDWALWWKTRATTILASVRTRWAIQVQTTHTHTEKNSSWNCFLMTKYLNCLSVQSSVMERPLTAGVWTRTAGRFLGPDHMMLSNLHVSMFLSRKVNYLCFKVYHGSNFFFNVQCLRPSLSGAAHSAPIAPPRCDPADKRWHHTAVRSGTENRGTASQWDQTRCSPGQNTADSTRKRWMNR